TRRRGAAGETWFPPRSKSMAATRAGRRVAAISSGRPRWLDGLPDPGPPKRTKLDLGRVLSQRHLDRLLLAVPVDLERDVVAGLLTCDQVAQLLLRRDRRTVRRDDDVSAEQVRLALDDHGRPTLPQTGLPG